MAEQMDVDELAARPYQVIDFLFLDLNFIMTNFFRMNCWRKLRKITSLYISVQEVARLTLP